MACCLFSLSHLLPVRVPAPCTAPNTPPPQAVGVWFLPKVLTWKERGCWPLLEEPL